MGDDQEGPVGTLAFVVFLLLPLRLRIGKFCCFCPVWSGSSAEVIGGVDS